MEHSQKSHSSAGYHNMIVVLFTLLCVLICGSLSLSLTAQTKTSDEHVTPKTVPGRNGKIAFTSTRDGNHEIYTMEPDGSNQTRLTNNPEYDISPKWSPDGTKIAFVRSIGLLDDIYVMNADGSNQTRLTTNRAGEEPPDWSPDGTRIVFDSAVGNTREIFVVDANGTNQTQLTNSGGFSPRWSPDGTRIMFHRFSGTVGIYVMNADGSNQKQLINSGYDYSPRWSPDSSRITFFSNRDGNSEIYVMNADGSNQTRLTNNPGSDYSPEWSPDGTRIVFRSLRDNNINLYVMNADGTSQTRLTNYTEDYDVFSPIFSPDGMRIMFSYGYSFAGELISSEIYVMNADGSNLVPLTNTGAYEAELDWHALSLTSPSCPNPIDCAEFFVRQQYLDFLNREPDTIGLANWTNTLGNCPNGGFGEFDNPSCDRVHVSAGFYLSEEFRGRGYWAYKFYEIGLDRRPMYAEFVPDMAQVGGAQSPQSEAVSKAAYMDAFVQRQAFKNRYDALSNAAYMDALETNAEVTLSNKAALVAALDGNQKTRAQVLREIVELQSVEDKLFIRAFVAMQYFGYLRRDPDTIGYNNWVTTLTADPSNFRHMIFGFLFSDEYRHRFGP